MMLNGEQAVPRIYRETAGGADTALLPAVQDIPPEPGDRPGRCLHCGRELACAADMTMVHVITQQAVCPTPVLMGETHTFATLDTCEG